MSRLLYSQKIIYLFTGSSGSVGLSIFHELSKHLPIISLSRQDNEYVVPINLLSLKIKSHICLLHFGGCTPVTSKSYSDFLQNESQLRNLLDKLHKSSLSISVIFASSMSVYKKSLAIKHIHTNSVLTIDDPYGLSKIACEDLLFSYFKQKIISGFISLRLPGIIANPASNNFVTKAINVLRSNLDLVVYNQSSDFNNIVSLNNIVSFILGLHHINLPNCKVNLYSYPYVSVLDIINFSILKLNSRSNIRWLSNNMNFTISCQNAIKHGYCPTHPLLLLESYIRSL